MTYAAGTVRRASGRGVGAVVALAVALAPGAARAWDFTLNDSLRGSTMGNPVGGSFGPDGWTVTARTDLIWYALPRLHDGYAEFTMANVTLANLNLYDHEVFAMYDDGYGLGEPISYGYFRDNYFKCFLRIYGAMETIRPGVQKLLWNMCPAGDPGHGACPCGNAFADEPTGGDGNWDGSPQRIRIEWGNGRSTYYRNGNQVVSIDWSGAGTDYGPSDLHLSLGTSRPAAVDGAGMPVGAVFSDLVVAGNLGSQATTCTPAPDAGTVSTDAGTSGDAGVPGCDPAHEITAVSLAPNAGSGNAQVFTAVYDLCEGASEFRIEQLWVGDTVAAGVPTVAPGFEAGMFFMESMYCAPRENKILTGTYGSLDCARSSVTLSGTRATVNWALTFNASNFSGTHNVYFDAKGGTATPEPRLGWTMMGTYTVTAPPPDAGGVDSGGAPDSGSVMDSGIADSGSAVDAGGDAGSDGAVGDAGERMALRSCICSAPGARRSGRGAGAMVGAGVAGVVVMAGRRRRRRG